MITSNYNDHSRDDLRRECKRREMTRYSSQKKHELVARLEADDDANAPETDAVDNSSPTRETDEERDRRQARNRRKAARCKMRNAGLVAGW